MRNTWLSRRRITAALAATVTSAALLALVAPAGAAGLGVAFRPFSAADSTWGGYVATGSGFTSISGSWVQPQVSCDTSNDLYAPWVGIDGYGSQTVEQTGVQTSCQSGSPVDSAWYEMYPAQPVFWNDPVNAGDTMTGSVVDNGGDYTITLTDNTQGWTETTHQQGQDADASAEAVIESPTHSYPSFSELDFSGITVNGQVFDNTNPQALSSGGYTPGALSNGSFSMTPGGGGWWWPNSRAGHQTASAGPIRY